jgi:hypothetical protein
MKPCALMATIAMASWFALRPASAAVQNIAADGTPIMGVAVDRDGTDDAIVANAGPIGQIVDGVVNDNLAPNAYKINGNGSSGAAGNGADTYAGGLGDRQFDYVGVRFSAPQYGVASVRVQNFLANDGGWWGPTSGVDSGAPLSLADLAAPIVQVTFDGATWSDVASAASDYLAKLEGIARGTGYPNATSTPMVTFDFAPQDGITGIRLIGEGAGPADGSGFIGVNEFEVIGIPQRLALEVNAQTGRVRLVNEVQSDVSIDFYQITSASGSLDPSIDGWNSLANPLANPVKFPAGSGVGDGWETLGAANSQRVAESFLLGASTLAPGESVTLGKLFGGGVQDLQLRYRTAAGDFVDVPAAYIARPALAADFNEDDVVDGADLAAWREAFGVTSGADADDDGDSDGADFLIWQRQFGQAVGNQAAIAAPEPAGISAAGMAVTVLSALRRFCSPLSEAAGDDD